MLWFVRYRRLVAALTLLALMMPAAVMAAGSLLDSPPHQHMHNDSHAASDKATTGSEAGHDKLLCSVVFPCEHGFCAGLGIVQFEQGAKAPKEGWTSTIALTVYPNCPECRSPPPKDFS